MHSPDRRFRAFMKSQGCEKGTPLAVACSGGPDSMALALLAREWADKAGVRVVALTVDSGARKTESAEAVQVGRWLRKRGIEHVVLRGKGKWPSQPDKARNARYVLLAGYCREHGIRHMLVAHHSEDQAEHFLLRLSQGGSVDGLSAMPAVTDMFDVTLLRPLLGHTKAELLGYLKKQGQRFFDAPENRDTTRDRVKMRRLLPVLAGAGISVEKLARTAVIMARARAHLEEETGNFLTAHCAILPEGYAVLRQMPASDEIGMRVLATLIMIVGGQEAKIRYWELEKLHSAVAAKGFKGMTLSGCVFQRYKAGVLVQRELRAMTPDRWIKPGTTLVWDNRFEVALSHAAERLKVGALTQPGWQKLSKLHKADHKLPNKNILYSLPALRDARGVIVAVPNLKYQADKSINCAVAFRQMV